MQEILLRLKRIRIFSDPVPFVRDPVSFVKDPVTFVRAVPFVRNPVPFAKDPGPILMDFLKYKIIVVYDILF